MPLLRSYVAYVWSARAPAEAGGRESGRRPRARREAEARPRPAPPAAREALSLHRCARASLLLIEKKFQNQFVTP